MKNTSNKQPSAPKVKKESYVSMDREERDILRTLGLRERALYPELKWLASFKTGEVQHFGKRVITFQFLADLITVPTTQGRAADTMNAKEACRVLLRLHHAGLVGEIENHPTKGLRFALPMSPICKKTALKLRQEAKDQEQGNAAKLPNQAHVGSAQNPITMRVGEVSDPSLSVMTISKGDQYDFHTDISNLAALHGSAADREMVAVARLKISGEIQPIEVRGATTETLTLDSIKDRLRRSRAAFSWIDNAESAVIYKRWIAVGHSVEKFEGAVEAVEDNFDTEPTPRAVDVELRGGSARQFASQREAQRAQRRGRVAL